MCDLETLTLTFLYLMSDHWIIAITADGSSSAMG